MEVEPVIEELRAFINGIEDGNRVISAAYTLEKEKRGRHATMATDRNDACERILAIAEIVLNILKRKQIKKEDLINYLHAHGDNVSKKLTKIELLMRFMKKLEELANIRQTASAEGSGEATSVEGAGEATSVEGAGEATVAEGTGEATSVNGADGATAAEGASDAASTEASGEANTAEDAVDALQTLQIGRD